MPETLWLTVIENEESKMIIDYCLDVGAGSALENHLMRLLGTTEQLTEDTVFTLEGRIDGRDLPATFYEEAEHSEPFIERIKQIEVQTTEGATFLLELTEEQSKHIMEEYFTDQNYEEMYVKLYEQEEKDSKYFD